ncbi:MFS transporter [Pseudooceanicola sp. CBS1P-1]|uniref:MFS transporter n=1 Tax=Pseudooceanicola albus TaxID=2692189 RepID=A0A6L7GA13_9RHOB|nr:MULTISPECIES: MFS transporter [Pseudooceanicola]MBT9386319.1 MFS transporter [Pseudooceanicola endophyticus]MXN20368.1 MFS transporter [Pseudooceanicola albus]
MEPRSRTFAPFGIANFRNLWMASQVSNLGGLVQMVGAGWLMTSLAGSSDMVALVQASNTLPIMAFSLVAGALADSFDRRRILLMAQLFMLAVSCALALFAWAGLLGPWGLLSFTFAIGSGMAFYNPSWQASMGDIVDRPNLSAAVSLNSMGFNLMRSVGPAIGGFLVALAGAAAAFGFNAVTYIPNVIALWLWKAPARDERLPREPLGQALGAGLRYMAMSPHLLKVLVRSSLFGFAASSVMALLPLVARDVLQGTALTYGLLLGFFGLGAIGGVLINGHLRARLANERIVVLAFLGFALGMVILAFGRVIAVSALGLMISGACWVVALSLFNVSVQMSTPRWVVGRALSFYQTATFGGMALGAWIWGLLAEQHSVFVALLVSAALLLLGAVVGRWFRLGEFGGLDLDPLNTFREPELRLDLQARSGPIVILIDYLIAEEDIDAFLAAIGRRRRVRIRDGARNWSLMRDLENPDLWRERFHVATWNDYLRHNARRTKSDLEGYEALVKLHRGAGRPAVHRMIERQAVPQHEDLVLKPGPDETPHH